MNTFKTFKLTDLFVLKKKVMQNE